MNSLEEQDFLVENLPPSLRTEVKNFTTKSLVDKIPFFKDKNQDFLFRVLPLLKGRKLYYGDLLYSESDVADEITFVIKGSVSLYQDISDKIQLPTDLIDKEKHAFNAPFSLYREGSYFGDEDILVGDARPGIDDEDISLDKKTVRTSTAEAASDVSFMTIKKRHLINELHRFPEIKQYMCLIAREKINYHSILIESVLERYLDPDQK